MKTTHALALSVLSLAALGGLLFSFQPEIGAIQDMNVYEGIAEKVVTFRTGGGELLSEYPPLASSIFYLVGSSARIIDIPFATAWSWFLMGIFCLIAFSTYIIDQKKDGAILLIGLLLSTLLLGRELLFARFDILVAILLFFAMRQFKSKNAFGSFFFLTVASFLKLVPVLLFPLLLWGTAKRHWKNAGYGALAGAAAASTIPLIFLSPSGIIQNAKHILGYHGERGMQLESTWSSFHMLWQHLHDLKTDIVFKAMSAQNAAFSSVAVQLSLAAILVAVIGIAYYTQQKPVRDDSKRQNVFLASLAAILALSPVLSPQFIVWLLPLACAFYIEKLLTKNERKEYSSTLPLLLIVIGLATHWVFPLHYGDLLNQQSLSVIVILCVRNALLFALAMVLLWPYTKHAQKWVKTFLEKTRKNTHIVAIGIAILFCLWGFMRYQISINTYNVQYAFNSNELQEGELPLFVPTDGETLRTYFILNLSTIHPSVFRIKPDDCLELLRINEVQVDPANSTFCDYSDGRSINVSKYVQSGENTIHAQIKDNGGLGGLSISLDRADPIVLLTDILLLLVIAGTGLLLAWKKGASWKVPIYIFTVGTILRVLYLLVTHYNTRGHDTDAHIDYIQYVATNFAIPVASQGWEYHQPPLYYFLTGTWYAIGSFFGRVEAALLQDIVLFSVLCSLVTLAMCIVIAHITFPTKEHRVYRYTFASLLAVWPSLIFITSRISNDVLYQPIVFGMIAVFMWWWKHGNIRHWYIACLLFVLAFLTKVSVAAFAPVFLVCFILQPKLTWSKKLLHAVLSGTCIILLTGWLPAYRYFAEHDSTKTFTLGNDGMSSELQTKNTPYNLLTFNPIAMLKTPYNNPWSDSNRRHQFPEYLFRSAFFGEFGFDKPLNYISIPLLFLGLILLVYALIGFIWEAIRSTKNTLPYSLIVAALFASIIVYRLKFTYTSNQDFRFITAAIIPLAYFALIGSAFVKKYIPKATAVIPLTIALSTAFFVLLYAMGG